jgi:20S proteasome alpha/beta subunit
MTAIVGIVDDTHIWIGADSAGSSIDADRTNSMQSEKVFQVGEFIFGVAGSFRVRDLLKYSLGDYLTVQHQDQSDEDFIYKTFLESVATCFKHGGIIFDHNDNKFESHFLFGYRGKLYLLQHDFSINTFHDSYAATGSGESVCLGSLYSTQDLPTEARIELALEAASRYTLTVSGPYVIGKIEI